MKNLLCISYLLFSLVGLGQSAKKQNASLKNELNISRAHYSSDVAVYLSDFKLLERARQDYRAYSKHKFWNTQNSLNKEIADLRKLMDFCEAFNIDYTKLVDEGALKLAEAFNFKIDADQERKVLTEILVFQNVKDTLVLEGLKIKAQNMLLKEQLTIYTAAQNQNSSVLMKQKSLISEVRSAAKDLDSMEVIYYRSILQLDKSLTKLRSYTDQLYEKECRDNKSGTTFTFRYETEFLTKPAPMIEPVRTKEKSLFESEIAEIPAEFPGGNDSLKKFLSEKMQFPEAITELGVEGRCYVQFVVRSTGEISDIVVVKELAECSDCSKEATRLVQQMPNWIPGKTDGKAVSSRVVLPIDFKLK